MSGRGLIAIVVIILLIALAIGVIVPMFLNVNVFSITPWAFPIVIIAGALIFLGYLFYSWGMLEIAKSLFNVSVVIIFIGILMIEMAVFGAFFTKTEISYEKCEKEENPINLASCILTGYKVPGNFMGWEWASFWIFFIILPFAFIFSVIWGLISPIKLFPKPVMSVITFVLSAYAVRQFFGAFLLDLAAYSIWGVVGIFIPLFISLMIKRVFDTFLGPLEETKKALYGMLGAHLYYSVDDIEKRLEKIRALVDNVYTDVETLKSANSQLEKLRKQLKSIEKEVKSNRSLFAQTRDTLLSIIHSHQNEIDSLKKRLNARTSAAS